MAPVLCMDLTEWDKDLLVLYALKAISLDCAISRRNPREAVQNWLGRVKAMSPTERDKYFSIVKALI